MYSPISLVGLARGTVEYGVQLAWGFPPRSKWTYGEVFHPAVVPQPHFSLIVFEYFVYLLSFALLYSVFFRIKPNAWLEASHTQGLCVFCVWSN